MASRILGTGCIKRNDLIRERETRLGRQEPDLSNKMHRVAFIPPSWNLVYKGTIKQHGQHFSRPRQTICAAPDSGHLHRALLCFALKFWAKSAFLALQGVSWAGTLGGWRWLWTQDSGAPPAHNQLLDRIEGSLQAGCDLGQIVWVTLLESAQAGIAGRRRRRRRGEHRSSQTPTRPQCQPPLLLQPLICCFLRKPGWAPSSRSLSTSLSEKEKGFVPKKWIFPVWLEVLSGVWILLILPYLSAGKTCPRAGLGHLDAAAQVRII